MMKSYLFIGIRNCFLIKTWFIFILLGSFCFGRFPKKTTHSSNLINQIIEINILNN
jgi:hypothetical protein